jgi:lipopolysaccharide export system permease protein
MPFALLIAVCHTFNRMHTDSEIIVLEAAGAPRTVQIRPVLLLAGHVGADAREFAVSRADRQPPVCATSSTARPPTSSATPSSSGLLPPHPAEPLHPVRRPAPDGDFDGMFIADMREPQSEFIYYANRGRVVSEGDTRLLVMATARSIAATHAPAKSRPSPSPPTHSTWPISPSRGTRTTSPRSGRPEIINPDPEDVLFQQQPHRFRGEAHRRLTDWLYPFAFAMTALFFSVGARSTREEQIWGLTTAVGVAIAFRGAAFLFLNDAGRSGSPPRCCTRCRCPASRSSAACFSPGAAPSISQRWLDRLSRLTRRVSHQAASAKMASCRVGRREGGRRMMAGTLFWYFARRYLVTALQIFAA